MGEWRASLQEGGAPSESDSPKVLRPAFGRRRVWSVAGAVLAAAAALLLVVRVQPEWWQRIAGDDGSDPRLEKLVAAVGTDRIVEGRLTGGFQYGPLRSTTRSGAEAENLSLLAAAAELETASAASPSTDNLHAYGVAQVLLGRYDEGVRTLEQAAADQPTNGRLQSDLSAAYLARSGTPLGTDDSERALAAAARALQADATLAEARFNRALALERLGLREQAIAAWREATERDRSAWRDEADRRLKSLESARKDR